MNNTEHPPKGQSSWSFYSGYTSMRSADTTEIGKFVAHKKLRNAQKEMLIDGINVLNEQGFLLAAAPTGIGKTAASLASTIEVARNKSKQNQILFLTGRQSQHKIVIETVKSINSNLVEI